MLHLTMQTRGRDNHRSIANLAIVGGHTVNGMAVLPTNILKTEALRDFYEMWPEKFSNKTNGITQRRWLKKANPQLSALITEANCRPDLWTQKSILNTVHMGKFSTDRTIKEYADEVWNLKAVPITPP